MQTVPPAARRPVVLVWDDLNTHPTAGMRRHIAERDWLTACRLPPSAPDLNLPKGLLGRRADNAGRHRPHGEN
ncbi:transposase [Streptomyces sp. NPDC101225]|uniref:transposase n=1 Tax=Streptomyces sp. NPDC101225 TaxID=3366135 RepID=UPI003813C3BB